MKNLIFTLVYCVLVSSCQTVSTSTKDQKEEEESLYAVAGAVVGRPLTEEDKKNIQEQYQKDPQARESIEAITGQLGERIPVKYCPLDGRRYSSHLTSCPEHASVELKELEP